MSKKIVAMLLALSMVLGVTACGAKETETPAEKPAAVEEVAEEAPAEEAETAAADGELSYDFTVGYSVLGENTNFFVTVGNSLQEACDSKGTELFRTIDDRDASKMKTAIDTFVMQGADIIVDFTVLAETGTAIAKNLEIPMLSVDCVYDGAYFFGVNNEEAGVTAGTYVAEWVNANWDGKIDAVQMLYNEANGEDVKRRVGAAVDFLAEEGLITKDVVTETNMNSSGSTTTDVSYVRSLVVDYLSAHPDATNVVILAQTDEQAMAANAAIESVGRTDQVIVVSHNCDPNVVQMMQEGKGAIVGTVNYNSAGYGAGILDACAKILAAKETGEEIDMNFYNKIYVVNKDNVWEYYPEAVTVE